MAFVTGLDLGKEQDPTAMAIVNQIPLSPSQGRRRWRYECVHLETWPLGTRYTDIAEKVRQRFDTPQLRWSKLAPDYTGVGNAVVERLREIRVQAWMKPILITSGSATSLDTKGIYHVPKIDLVAALQIVLQAELLVVDSRLKRASDLKDQLARFRVKITKAANETFGAASGSHDDLVLAIAMAIWLAEQEGCGDITEASAAKPGEGNIVESAPPGAFMTGNDIRLE